MSPSPPPPPGLAVYCNPEAPARSRHLAASLQLPVVETAAADAEYPYLLIDTERGLALQQTGRKAAGPVRVEFATGTAAHRRSFGGGELIVKAVGGGRQRRPMVLDATAGLGRDSFVLASWGYPVVLCERVPVVACLLRDGLRRAAASDDAELRAVIARMRLQAVDALDYLRGETAPEVVVIDPMFPPSKKTALVKKDMQAFHRLVGADTDSESLLALALTTAIYRVVVKRPLRAEYLADRQPSFSVTGKAIRFDIYTIKAFDR